MIWHFFEVWVTLLLAFLVGCGLGAAAYAGIGNSALGGIQGRLADAIGDVLDTIKARFGLGPDWRDGFRLPVERPLREVRPLRRSRKPRFGRYRQGNDDPSFDEADGPFTEAGRERGEAWPDDEVFRNEDQWDGDPHAAASDDYGDDAPEIEPPMRVLPAAESGPIVGKRPAPLLAPRNGVPDSLQRIRGIGKANEELLNSFGIFHFGQIAAWTPAEAQWVAERMPFPERMDRDDWIGQAIILASGGETGYMKSADRRRVKRAADAHDDDAEDGET